MGNFPLKINNNGERISFEGDMTMAPSKESREMVDGEGFHGKTGRSVCQRRRVGEDHSGKPERDRVWPLI
jgi:hypothetical protein